MAAIRTFNKMITKCLLGETNISDDSDRFTNELRFAAEDRHEVTEESGPVTVAPADDEGGFTLRSFHSLSCLLILHSGSVVGTSCLIPLLLWLSASRAVGVGGQNLTGNGTHKPSMLDLQL